ncbi:hypothetical protein AAC387_Pa10g0544 [Persea americana]
MQQGHAPDTSEPRGKEVDEEGESSIYTSSSSAGIPPDCLGDEGHYRDDEPLTYETVEHFPGAIKLDPRSGYVRHVGGTEAGSSSGVGLAGQGVGECTHGHYGGYVDKEGAICMDSMRIIHMTLIGYPLRQHRYFLSNIC